MAVLSHRATALKTGWEITQGSSPLPQVRAFLLLPWWCFPCSQRTLCGDTVPLGWAASPRAACLPREKRSKKNISTISWRKLSVKHVKRRIGSCAKDLYNSHNRSERPLRSCLAQRAAGPAALPAARAVHGSRTPSQAGCFCRELCSSAPSSATVPPSAPWNGSLA